MRKIVYLMATMLMFASCNKEGKGKEVDPNGCKSLNQELLIAYEKGDCEGFLGLKDSDGNIDKDKFYSTVIKAGDEERELQRLVINFKLHGDNYLLMSYTNESLNYVYKGSNSSVNLYDSVEKYSYLLNITASKRDACGRYVGFEEKDVYIDGEPAKFIEIEGKRYIVMKKKCRCGV